MQQESYDQLVQRFRALGATDPEAWARSQVNEGIAQLARFCFLRNLWRETIDSWTTSDAWMDREVASLRQEVHAFDDGRMALKRLLDAGVDRKDVQQLCRWIASMVAFDVINRVDEGYDPELDDSLPGWRLMETQSEELTGRDVGGLHESLLEFDPTGREGRP